MYKAHLSLFIPHYTNELSSILTIVCGVRMLEFIGMSAGSILLLYVSLEGGGERGEEDLQPVRLYLHAFLRRLSRCL